MAKVIVTVVTNFVARIVLKVIAKLSLFVVVLRSLWFFWGICFVRLLIRSLWSPAREGSSSILLSIGFSFVHPFVLSFSMKKDVGGKSSFAIEQSPFDRPRTAARC